jgi:hypothetical protein
MKECSSIRSSTPGFGGSRTSQGSIGEAMRRNRGNKDIRPRLCRGPSQEFGEAVTYLRRKVGVNSSFVLAIADGGVSHRISGNINRKSFPLTTT